MAQKKRSKWAVASGIISIIAAVLLFFSGYGYQWDWWSLGVAFQYFIPASALLALFSLALVVIFVFASRSSGRRKQKGWAVTGAVLSISVLVFLGYWYNQSQKYPPIHDITTDFENPPHFVEIVVLRADAPNPVEYGGDEIAQIQQEYYPQLETLYLEVPYERAFKRALSAALKMPWEGIVSYSKQTGMIEATDQLAWFGFKDDIVIRVDTSETIGMSKIDARSVSRIGKGDLGVNAHRIREYFEMIKTSQENN